MTSQPDASSAATAQRVYSTAPLNYTEREMRLVELQQNDTSEKLKCVLRPYPVEGPHPPYIALSYAWGSDVGYADIELNGSSFSVAWNLWHFLHQMTLCEKFQTYWIDAICIDQMNLRERNHQVQMMRQIYSNAESVYAWLGVEDKANHSNTAMTFLAKREVFEANTVYTKRFWTPRQAKAMLSLCERPYWTRIWIVQELLLPKTVTVLCGSKEIPWYRFEGFFSDIATIVNLGWGQHTGASHTFASAASKIVKVRCDWNKQSALPLNALLHLCRDQQSTDVRDKVYALCGLANDSDGLGIDYGIAPKQLLVVVLEHTCITLSTSLKDSKLRKQLVQTGQLLREILKVYLDDQQLEALIISRAPQSRFDKDCSNEMSPHDTSPNATDASVSREYQSTSNHIDMKNIPLYSANTLTSSVPYQAGAYAYDVPTSVPVNPYNIQQASYYSPNMPHPVSYPRSHEIQPLPTLPGVRRVFNPNVRSEGTSPAQSNQMYADPPYGAELKRSTLEPTEGSGAKFATDVDTLMRAIQAKQSNPSPENDQKVCYSFREFKFDLLMFRRTTHQRMPRSPGSVISALCPTATRASTRRHTLRSTYAPILVTSHFLAKHLDAASPSRSWVTSRHMKGATPESDHTAATSVARHSPNVATFAHTRLFTNRSSPSAAS